MAFKQDFASGKRGENLVKQLFKRHNIELESNTDKEKLKDYDLVGKIGKSKILVEIKWDYLACKTGNLAIEHFNPVKDEKSGISSTKANIWCQIILDLTNPTVWFTSVKTLKDYIKKNKPFKVVERVGDGNANLYLYRLDNILEDIFHRMDTLQEAEFVKKIKELLSGKDK